MTKYRKQISAYVLLIIPLGYFIVFKYFPLINAQIAFKDFSPVDGVFRSRWIGFEHFKMFFTSFYFAELIRNTLFYSFAKLVVGIPTAVIFAVALSESRSKFLRKAVQTISYVPHFLSWVIMLGILLMLLSPGEGLINKVLVALGKQPISFLTNPRTFPLVVIFSDLWKELGWSAIIFLAALLGIDPTLYEAASAEGANRFQRVIHITLPGILPVVMVVVLLRLGTILDAGFHQIFILYSTPVLSVADIIDTWVYRQGILDFQFSLATAVGLFKGVIGMILLLCANWIIRRLQGTSLY
jgi:putative aldouronate transport system permease protein